MNETKIEKPKLHQIVVSNLVLALSIVISVLFLVYWDEIKGAVRYGYLFIFLMSYIAGSPIPVPDPYMIVVFTMAPVLNPLMVGVVSGAGVAAGQTTAFFLGMLGRDSFLWAVTPSRGTARISRTMNRMLEWAKKRSSIAVLVLSAMFNPVFTPLAITMGALHFQLIKFFIMCLIGNIIKSLLIAYCGYFGLGILLRLFSAKF